MPTILNRHSHQQPTATIKASPEPVSQVEPKSHHQAVISDDEHEEEQQEVSSARNNLSPKDLVSGGDQLLSFILDGDDHKLDPFESGSSFYDIDSISLPDMVSLSSSDALCITAMDEEEKTGAQDKARNDDIQITGDPTSSLHVHYQTEASNKKLNNPIVNIDQVEASNECLANLHSDAQKLIPDFFFDAYHDQDDRHTMDMGFYPVFDTSTNHEEPVAAVTVSPSAVSIRPQDQKEDEIPLYHLSDVNVQTELLSTLDEKEAAETQEPKSHSHNISSTVQEKDYRTNMEIVTTPVESNSSQMAPIHQDQKRGTLPIHKDVVDRYKIVICERGGKSNNNPGNKIYLEIIEDKKDAYRAIKGNTYKDRKRKTKFIKDALKEFNNDGYVFVGRKDDWYYEVCERRSCRKISQAFREERELKNVPY